MLSWDTIITLILVWNLVGFWIWCIVLSHDWKRIRFLNPIWIFKKCKVNILGTILLFLFFNLASPMISIIYWLYKLCTVGRR